MIKTTRLSAEWSQEKATEDRRAYAEDVNGRDVTVCRGVGRCMQLGVMGGGVNNVTWKGCVTNRRDEKLDERRGLEVSAEDGVPDVGDDALHRLRVLYHNA